MRNLKKFFAVVLVVALIITSMATAFAATTTTNDGTDQAAGLHKLGLYDGVGYQLTDSVKRFESMLMLGKVLGILDAAAKEFPTDADAMKALDKYTDAKDIPYLQAKQVIAYEVENGMVKGDSATTLNPNGSINAAEFATMIARNITGNYDLQPDEALATLEDAGAFNNVALAKYAANTNLTRGVLVQVAFDSLKATCEAYDGMTLINYLAQDKDEQFTADATEMGLIVPVTADTATVTPSAITLTVGDDAAAKLPAKATVAYSNDTTEDVAITWPAVDTSKAAAEQTITGTVGDTGLTVDVKVTVVAKALSVDSVTGTNLKQLTVKFNTAVDKTKAETAANYTVGGVTVSSAALQTDGQSVLLNIADAQVKSGNNVTYTVVVKSGVGLAADYTNSSVKVVDVAVPAVTGVTQTGKTTFDITFSEPIKTIPAVTLNNGIYGVTVGASTQNSKISVSINASGLPDGSYPIKITGYKDFSDLPGDDYTGTLAYAKATDPITATVTSAAQNKVVIKFNRAVHLTGANPVNYFYQTFSAWNPTTASSTDNITWTLNFTNYYIPAGTTNLTVKYNGGVSGNDITDDWGTKLASDIVIPVTVTADTTAPTIDTTKTVVSDEKTVKLYFSEDVLGATTNANYVVKDSTGTDISSKLTSVGYTPNSTNGTYIAQLNFSAALAGGNYTVDVKNITDNSISQNKIVTVTIPFTITDLTAISLSAVTVTAIDSANATDPEILYVTFPEKVATSGQYSALDAGNYYLDVSSTTKGALSTFHPTLSLFGTTGKVVKITIDAQPGFSTTFGNTLKLTVGKIADAVGNVPQAISYQTPAIVAEAGATIVGNVKQTGNNTFEAKFNKVVTSILPDAFTVGGTTVASIDSTTVNSDNTTTVKFTITDDNKKAIASTLGAFTDYTTVTSIIVNGYGPGPFPGLYLHGNYVTTETQQKSTDAQLTVADYRAPVVMSVTTGAPSSVSHTATESAFYVTFTEDLDSTTISGIYTEAGGTTEQVALYATDFTVVKVAADGTTTTLKAGVDYTVRFLNGNHKVLVIEPIGHGGFAANTKYQISTNATINYIRDASAQMNLATPSTTVYTITTPQ